MEQKQILLDFLEWMDKTAAENPMQLETDNEDIVLMYLEGCKPICPGQQKCVGDLPVTREFDPL